MTTPTAGPRLLGPAEVRSLAAELDLRPTKQRGQNFVIDANTVRRIVRDSGIDSGDVVLEVGPGLGSLTLALLAVARRVVAVEVDTALAERLPQTIRELAPEQADAFEVVLADALRIANDETSALAAAIVTEDEAAARAFLDGYRGTAGFWNAPTRFTDGFALLGTPETGINVDRTPGPRGPVTYRDLWLRQYRVVGDGTQHR